MLVCTRLYSSIDSSSFKLENESNVVNERKDGPSVSLTCEDEPQPLLKVNINLSLKKTKLLIMLMAYILVELLLFNKYIFSVFKQREKKPTLKSRIKKMFGFH